MTLRQRSLFCYRTQKEHIVVDPIASRLLRRLTEGRPPNAPVFGWTGKGLTLDINWQCSWAFVCPYCLRRNGATWHFSSPGNVDFAT